jgi:hypothetical protein
MIVRQVRPLAVLVLLTTRRGFMMINQPHASYRMCTSSFGSIHLRDPTFVSMTNEWS